MGSAAKIVSLVGVMAATVECGKLALASLPNIEVVSLLLGLYSYVFGWYGVAAAVVFVCIEPVIWGFGSWILTYFLYWPLFALVFMLLGRAKTKNRFILAGVAVALTFWFGVLSSLVDVGLFMGYFDRFFYRFGIYYARGISFYVTQIICNAILFVLVFPYLARPLFKSRAHIFDRGKTEKQSKKKS